MFLCNGCEKVLYAFAMHIDYEGLVLETEADVEQKVIFPLLTGPTYLEIPGARIKAKGYLAPTPLNKKAGQTSGSYPDFSVWYRSFPCLIIEAKSPEVSAETGYIEAQLYAQFLNQRYPTGLNPAHFVLATNGIEILAGYSDAEPLIAGRVADLAAQTQFLTALQAFCDDRILDLYAIKCLSQARRGRATFPYNLSGGHAALRTTLRPNEFAAPLAPLLQRYFSSSRETNIREIVERAYVSSDEVTEYDKILESLLKERVSSRRNSGVIEQLHPERSGEDTLKKTIAEFAKESRETGHLQLIQGSVGSGKSLFMERYRQQLQPESAKAVTKWATIDFNNAPVSLVNAEDWLCQTFIDSFQQENSDFDMGAASVIRGIFSRNIQRRKAVYAEFERSSAARAAEARAVDLAKWQDNFQETARGIAEYILGSRNEVLVVVMDNVDRLDLQNQLAAFQLTLWFMQLTKAFVILQMRDETYERFKDKPPLDAYRTGVIFHISPPRFIDVAKRRLELSIESLSDEPDSDRFYEIESGLRIRYTKQDLISYLRKLYNGLFDRRRNISRVLESLAGKDVRRALSMFVSIITSGHLSATAIASNTVGGGEFQLKEHTILKILMRTNHRLFAEGDFVQNIFSYDDTCEKPDNFLLIEILFYLFQNRKRVGSLGLEGYFSCYEVIDTLQMLGYVPGDVLLGLNRLVKAELIITDRMNSTGVSIEDSVKILAAGWVHLRILSGRFEYVWGVLSSTPIAHLDLAQQIAELVRIELERGEVNYFQKTRAVDAFLRYLWEERSQTKTPFSDSIETGADYVIGHIREALEQAKNPSKVREFEPDALDLDSL